MMKRIAMSIMVVMALSACSDERARTTYALSDEQLAHLMLDMQLAEVALGEVKDEKLDSLRTLFWEGFSTIYKQPISTIEAEIRMLEEDPEKMIKVMDRVQFLADSIR